MNIAPNQKTRRVKIIKVDEQWSLATLEDGTVIRAKLVFLGAHLVLDENNKPVLNSDGSPMYGANLNQILAIDYFEEVPKGTKVS